MDFDEDEAEEVDEEDEEAQEAKDEAARVVVETVGPKPQHLNSEP